MTIEGSFERHGEKVNYEITDKQKDLIINCLMDFYKKYEYCGEGIMQDDDSQIYAPDCLATIADNFIEWTIEEGE